VKTTSTYAISSERMLKSLQSIPSLPGQRVTVWLALSPDLLLVWCCLVGVDEQLVVGAGGELLEDVDVQSGSGAAGESLEDVD
jgi:hypothetical protein